eukprot:Gb_15758 [translate_table: standard]
MEIAMARCWSLLVIILVVMLTGQAFGSSKKPIPLARRDDIPYIKCGVCEEIAKQLHLRVNNKRNQISPKQLSEYQIIEVAENICNLKKEEGDWMLHLDIVEDGDKLKLVEQAQEGECNTECKTIEKACQEVLGYHDTDVAEFLFKNEPQISALSNFLCNDLSRACSVKAPPTPKDRVPGEPFIPKSSKDAEMEKILRSMADMPGAPNMKMYSKDDLMNMPNFGGEDEDEDDEDDDYTPDTGNIKRASKSGKTDWKKSLIDGAQSTLHTLKAGTHQVVLSAKQNLQKASDKIWKWYKGQNSGSKPSKANKGEL